MTGLFPAHLYFRIDVRGRNVVGDKYSWIYGLPAFKLIGLDKRGAKDDTVFVMKASVRDATSSKDTHLQQLPYEIAGEMQNPGVPEPVRTNFIGHND